MKIIAEYSFNKGKEFIEKHHKNEFDEIKEVISLVNAQSLKKKISKEKTMVGRHLFSPIEINKEFKRLFKRKGWNEKRFRVETTVSETGQTHRGFREMDMIKNKLGVEIQFGKYAFMVYNVLAKMTIFSNQKYIDSGVEIVPMLDMTKKMSTGVSSFEQIKTDLEYRGVSNIDIPVLILGINVAHKTEHQF